MILLGLVGLIVLIIICVVVIPIHFSIDTDNDFYLIRQPGFFSFRIFPEKNFSVETRIAGFKIPLRRGRKESAKKIPRRKTYSLASLVFLFDGIVRSFRIHRFELDIDTGDFALNAQLVPLFHFASWQPYSLNINFMGRNYLRTAISVRPLNLIWTYLIFLTKK